MFFSRSTRVLDVMWSFFSSVKTRKEKDSGHICDEDILRTIAKGKGRICMTDEEFKPKNIVTFFI